MKKKNSGFTRRQFLIAGSAVMAAPLVSDLSSPISAAAATTAKKSIGSGRKVYYIGHDCIGCQACRMFCPADAIDYGESRNEIDQEMCEGCGTCYEECPISVISET
jgi:Pyruvate/2-oxoacid:ferredoxin oxidoreductase delta subunit